MDRKRLKFLMLGAGMVVTMGFLLMVGMSRPGGFAYYLTVSEFVQSSDRGNDGFRVNGKVVEGSIDRGTTGQDIAFVMTDGQADLAVQYHGIVPDTFVDGAEVVVEGRLSDNGKFVAHTLLAKCPSKYESSDEYPASREPLEVSSAE